MIHFSNSEERRNFIHFFLFIHVLLLLAWPPSFSRYSVVPGKIAINRARMEEIGTIPGIGWTRMQLIYAYLRKKGTIQNEKELEQIKGIGKKRAQKIAGYISFE